MGFWGYMNGSYYILLYGQLLFYLILIKMNL
jgi:hypothetical protein